ncbi:POT-type proton-dependent oligopeptide transporter [Sphingomonas sp. PAMC 26621]|uniref:POT-type proton-dependent oligopeptide transporter n=1 Tax=Sphingomonas sp. PAMC 26621 TaxID=1112213 RepID=UPI000287D00C|nr:MFS transporter [Sphingomonas sp. PAMC 26621]
MARGGSLDTGHPIRDRRFLALAMLEFWERFAMAGVKSLLVLILADQIFAHDLAPALGAPTLRGMFERWFGPLSSVGLASQVYGYAGALLYLAVPLGGLIGDLFASRRLVIYSAAATMLAGLALMIGVATFLPGLALFMVATGTLKGNLSAQVGRLFHDEAERQRGYAVYLGFLNAGVICGPLVCGGVATGLGWPYAIGAAAAAIAIGTLGYAATAGRTADVAAPDRATRARHGGGTGLRGIPVLVAAILSVYCCWAAYEQLGDIFLVWARTRIDLHVAGWTMPVAWFVSLDGVFTLLLIVGVQGALGRAARRGGTPAAQDMILAGGLACAAGYGVLALASRYAGAELLSIGWALLYLLLVDLAVVLVWPSGLSLIAAHAPPRFIGFWMGVFYLHGFFASLWVGISGSAYGRISDSSFWLLQAGMAGMSVALALVAILLRQRDAARQATITSA